MIKLVISVAFVSMRKILIQKSLKIVKNIKSKLLLEIAVAMIALDLAT